MKPECPRTKILRWFLGDYGDRGAEPAEVYCTVLTLKLTYPHQVILLRGNHEAPSDLLGSPHDLPINLQQQFEEKWVGVYAKLRELFSYLYTAVYVPERYLMVHGGLPAKLRSLQNIAEADRLHPEKTYLEELLWSDPDETIDGVFASPRGAGNLFGKAITEQGLKKVNANILIRGHEPCPEGYKINHNGKVLTLFSRKGSPYFNQHGAYLDLPLAEKTVSASQLVPWIHKF